MRILLMNYEYPPLGGGAATATQQIALGLTGVGHEVHILTAGFSGLPARSVERGIQVRRLPCLRRNLFGSSMAEMLSYTAAASLAAPFYIRTHRLQAVIAFFAIPTGPAALWSHLLAGIPYVVAIRGGDAAGAAPELDRFHAWLRPLRRMILKKSLAVTAPSEGLARLVRRADPVEVTVIPNGVDAGFFHPPVNKPENPFVFLYVGRFQPPQKNLGLLMASALQLKKMTREPFIVHLVGAGPQEEELRAMRRDLDLADRVTFSGWTDRADMPGIYGAAHCLVNCSRYEGLPNNVLEAMACGLPVVATRVTGNETLVDHGRTGLLMDLGDPGGLAAAMKEVLENPVWAAKMGRAGRETVVRQYTWDSVARAYADLFRSTPSGDPGKPRA